MYFEVTFTSLNNNILSGSPLRISLWRTVRYSSVDASKINYELWYYPLVGVCNDYYITLHYITLHYITLNYHIVFYCILESKGDGRYRRAARRNAAQPDGARSECDASLRVSCRVRDFITALRCPLPRRATYSHFS